MSESYLDNFGKKIVSVVYDGTEKSIEEIKKITGLEVKKVEGQVLEGAADLILMTEHGLMQVSKGMAVAVDEADKVLHFVEGYLDKEYKAVEAEKAAETAPAPATEAAPAEPAASV